MKNYITQKMKLISIVLISSFTAEIPKDNINIPGPISFDGETYSLAWNHAKENYFKQEYLRKKDNLEKFNKMVTVDLLIADMPLKDIVASKVNELENRKTADPVVNYEVIENKQSGEILLDFVMSDGDLYEWNAYRYKIVKTAKGNAVFLFGYSIRSFDKAEISQDKFFPYLKENRSKMIAKVAAFSLPKVSIK